VVYTCKQRRKIRIQNMNLTLGIQVFTFNSLSRGVLEFVWECVFKKIICVFKPNRNFGVFEIVILKTQILKS
jgi:hypothetical protein